MRKHDAVAGADHGLGIKLIGGANAWPKVLCVAHGRRGAVAGVGAGPCELQGAAQACDWVCEIGVEKAPHVIYFRDAGEVVIAKAEIESELRGQLPVVLNIGRDGAETRAVLRMQRIIREAALVDLADQEAGVGITSARCGGIGAGRDARGLGDGVGEGNGSCSARGADGVVQQPCNLPAKGEGVLADGPLHVIEHRVVFGEGHVCGCAAPVCRGIRPGEGHDWEGLLRLANRQSGHAHG